jgi:O-acetyl-ADP-ribose deacetylase (regulator of RNase III)
MLHEVSGDILLSQVQAIAHGVAPNDGYNQGLALALRENWQAMYKDFRHCCQTSHPKAGELWTWASADGRRVASLFTEDGGCDHGAKPGRASAENLNYALKALRKRVEAEGVTRLALPRLATGVGGMNWNEVRPLIEENRGDVSMPVYVCVTYHKNGQARQPV